LVNIGERKTVLLAEREHDAVVGRGRLKLEVEGATEPLAQRQPPGPVDATAEGRVDDKLHPAAFVKKALRDDRLLRGQRAQRGAGLGDIGDDLLGAGLVETTLAHQPSLGFLFPRVCRVTRAADFPPLDKGSHGGL
jgi:hypothetical protein